MFHAIRENGPILLQHPYESFITSVERFLREASQDPKVMAIKMTLYRTAEHSKIIQYLIDAADQLSAMMFQGDTALDESRISIVPFRAMIHVGTEHADWLSGAAPAGWNGCFLARFEPAGAQIARFGCQRELVQRLHLINIGAKRLG